MPSMPEATHLASGKVREIYEWDDDLLMVASDRISTYDVVMPTPIPDKGKVLNRMSVFWFELTKDIVPNHFISEDVPEDVLTGGDSAAGPAAAPAAGAPAAKPDDETRKRGHLKLVD